MMGTRWFLAWMVFGGSRIALASPPPDPGDVRDPVSHDGGGTIVPDVGEIRYRDPRAMRQIWAGLAVSGVVLPQRLGLFDRRVWTARVHPTWAIALAKGVAIGGRHGLTWYDATSAASSVRSRVHEHEVEFSVSPLRWLGRDRAEDRLVVGYGVHSIETVRVGGQDFKFGGLRDSALSLGYAREHKVGYRWALAWRIDGRYVWVYLDTQRQLRASARITVTLRTRSRVWLEGIVYGVHRDEDQAGNPLPRLSAHGQFRLGYGWMSAYGVGAIVIARLNTGFLSGEAPVYEIREEALNTVYGELLVGLQAVF